MKKFYEVVKDILYDSIDYIIMIGIVGIVILIIGWRLDLLFAKDALDVSSHNIPIEDNTDKDSNQNSDNDNEEKPTDNDNDKNNSEETNGQIIKITIPSGSLPSKIGSILEDNGLVSSKADFVLKAQELKLDTKLKSGNYEIKSNSSIEEILTILTK
ncbi:hypothetical protein RBU61_09595 [Tissierella sp. MB52-C2]|uniref:hypothetical protein n=1 Tax=Tissierella sp. MB52-C2 TaxID=3070999 RepID=UPI00280C35FA|nr:hypothetical protein [Tissierella sp. MB52-C2]WMM26905.1 hypothetical protein RBU61_09595 [Tissierella sp. MB52-C2]